MAAYDLLLTGRALKPGRLFYSAAVAAVLFVLLSTGLHAQGNLLITPKRLVFDSSRRTMDLNLANIGKDTAVYAISFLQVRMKEDGNFETITEPDPGQMFADKYLRFFPRTVRLGPGEAQVVKVQLQRTGELAEGEYRSHIYFRAVPKEDPLGEPEIRDTTTLTVRLTPIFGITIPAIIRSGNTRVSASISDLSLEYVSDTIPLLKMKFNRTGNMSIYGDLAVNHVSPQGKVTRVGVANGIAVYTPNPVRGFSINLNPPKGTNLRSGKIRVTYSAPSDVRPEKYAEAELVIR
jgi:hypothetical protein